MGWSPLALLHTPPTAPSRAAMCPCSSSLHTSAPHAAVCSFVCPTEIIAFSDRAKEFEALNCQVPWLVAYINRQPLCSFVVSHVA